jgi:hypothetical protein
MLHFCFLIFPLFRYRGNFENKIFKKKYTFAAGDALGAPKQVKPIKPFNP